MDVRRTCTRCGESRPEADFPRDARLKSGRRATCKPCDRRARGERRKPDQPRPGALVLVPTFPLPPPSPPEDAPPLVGHVMAGASTGLATYAAEAERFIAALDPPAGPADALLVRSLRGLADLLDRFQYGADVVKDSNALVAGMIRVQRELAATRAAKGKTEPVAAPKGKLGRFGGTG